MQIHEAVKAWRKRKNLTQQTVADGIEMSRPQYARFEKGTFGFKAKDIKAIAETFGADANELLGITKNTES